MKPALLMTTVLSLAFLPLAVSAEPAAKGLSIEDKAKRWDSLSDADKKAAVEKNMQHRAERREKLKEKFESMSPEEKAMAKEAHKERKEERRGKAKEKLDAMTPEQREAAQKHRL